MTDAPLSFQAIQGTSPHSSGPAKPKWALDLFSGPTHSVVNRLKQLGYQVVSLDIDPKTKPDLTQDIMQWDFRAAFPKGKFEIIAASVPCTEYSKAKTIGVRDLTWSDRVVRKVREIVQHFNPEIWWIENTREGLLSHREVVDDLHYLDLDYCQFCDWGYKKPTRFWGCKRITNLHPVLCRAPQCANAYLAHTANFKHRFVLGGSNQKFGTSLKGRIPPGWWTTFFNKVNFPLPRMKRTLVTPPSANATERVIHTEGWRG